MSIKKSPFYTLRIIHIIPQLDPTCYAFVHLTPRTYGPEKKPPVPLCTDYSIKRSENTSTPTRGR